MRCMRKDLLVLPALIVGGRLGPNVKTSFNPDADSPILAETASMHSLAAVMGWVALGERVYVAPCVSIRDDEEQTICIGGSVEASFTRTRAGEHRRHEYLRGRYRQHAPDRWTPPGRQARIRLDDRGVNVGPASFSLVGVQSSRPSNTSLRRNPLWRPACCSPAPIITTLTRSIRTSLCITIGATAGRS
jgi:hypothetical protein